MNEPHAARQCIGQLGDQRSAFRIVRAALTAESAADAAAHVQLELSRGDAEEATAVGKESVVIVHFGVCRLSEYCSVLVPLG